MGGLRGGADWLILVRGPHIHTTLVNARNGRTWSIDFQDPGLEECYVSEPFLSYQSFRAIVIDFISRHYTSTSHICLPRLSDKAVYKVAQDFQGWFGKFKVDDERGD